MQSLLLVLALGVSPISFAASAYRCDRTSLCNARAANPQVKDRISNGQKIKGSEADPKIRAEMTACYEKVCPYRDPARIQKLFAEVKKRIPNVLAKGRPDSALSADERKLNSLLSKVTLMDPVKDPKCSQFCSKIGSAHFYDGQVCLCPALEQVSDESLLFVLAHEAGHSADICSGAESGIKAGQHPFEKVGGSTSVIECLGQNGIAGRSPDEEKIYKAKSKLVVPEMLGMDPESKSSKITGAMTGGFARTIIAATHGDSIHCRGVIGHSEMWEASADVFGFSVLGDYLKDHPLPEKDPENPRRLFAMLLKSCKGKSSDNLDSHSSGLDRIEKIGFSIPSVRDSLGCTDHTPSMRCDYEPEKTNGVPATDKQGIN